MMKCAGRMESAVVSSVTVDLSVPDNRPGGDYRGGSGQSEGAGSGLREGLERIVETLGRFGLKATFATPAVMARVQARELRELTQAGHVIASEGLPP